MAKSTHTTLLTDHSIGYSYQFGRIIAEFPYTTAERELCLSLRDVTDYTRQQMREMLGY